MSDAFERPRSRMAGVDEQRRVRRALRDQAIPSGVQQRGVASRTEGARVRAVDAQAAADAADAKAVDADAKAVEAQGTATIADAKADTAQTTAEQADEKAQEALDRPAGGTKITSSLNAPTEADAADDGSVWWQTDSGDSIIGQWQRIAGAWVKQELTSSLIAETLVGKKIVGAEIEGATITATSTLSAATLNVMNGILRATQTTAAFAGLEAQTDYTENGLARTRRTRFGVGSQEVWNSPSPLVTSVLQSKNAQGQITGTGQLELVHGNNGIFGNEHLLGGLTIRSRSSASGTIATVQFVPDSADPSRMKIGGISELGVSQGVSANVVSAQIGQFAEMRRMSDNMPWVDTYTLPLTSVVTVPSRYVFDDGSARRSGQLVELAIKVRRTSGNLVHAAAFATLTAAYRQAVLADSPVNGIASGGTAASGMVATIVRSGTHPTIPGGIVAITPAANNTIEVKTVLLMPTGT